MPNNLPIEYKKYNDEIKNEYIYLAEEILDYYKDLIDSVYRNSGKDETIKLYNKIRQQFNRDIFVDSTHTLLFDLTVFTRNLIL